MTTKPVPLADKVGIELRLERSARARRVENIELRGRKPNGRVRGDAQSAIFPLPTPGYA